LRAELDFLMLNRTDGGNSSGNRKIQRLVKVTEWAGARKILILHII
jgi:hypothetical protein